MDKVDCATRSAEERRRLQKELVAADVKQKQAEAAQQVDSRRTAEMMKQMQACSLLELATKLRDAEQKTALRRQETGAESAILSALHVESVAAAETLLEGRPTTELKVEQAGVAAQVETLEARTRDLYAAFTRVSDRMDAVGGDNVVAKIEERRRTRLLTNEGKRSAFP